MSLSNDLISQFAKAVNKEEPKPKESTAYGTVVEYEGQKYVQLDGSELRVPVTTEAEISENERVSVRIKDHIATIIGNTSSPSASKKDINVAVSDVEILVADKVSSAELAAQTARIDDLIANDVVVKGRLSASEASIGELEADNVVIHDTLTAQNARIDNIVAESIDVDYLKANYAEIDLANVNNAWIQNGVIKNAAIKDEQVISVSANKLTAGTIDASNITVTNLNADNITTGTINGQRIGKESISLDKLAEEVPTKEYLDDVAENLQGQIDGAIQSWTSNNIPTLNNYPASSWTDAKTKREHVGDVLYVINAASTADGYCYRFAETDGVFSWILIKDSDVTKALQDLIDVKGDISDLESFQSSTSAWIRETDEELSSVKNRTTSLETSMGNKVSTDVFNELRQDVDENSASITSLSETVESKADGSTVTTLSNTVTAISQRTGTIETKISQLETDVEEKADGSTVETLSSTVTTISQKTDAIETNVSKKVGKDEVISSINQTAEAITINAGKINLSGVVTAINEAGDETTINGDKITTGSIKADQIDVTDLFSENITATGNIYFDNDKYTLKMVQDDTSDDYLELTSSENLRLFAVHGVSLASGSEGISLLGVGGPITMQSSLISALANTDIRLWANGNVVLAGGIGSEDAVNAVKIAVTADENYTVLNEGNVSDYVVANGSSGIWKWRKWNSGLAECWGKLPISNMTCTTQASNWYRTSSITNTSDDRLTYPITFTDIDNVQMQFLTSTGTGGVVWSNRNVTGGAFPLNSPGSFYITRMTSTDKLSGRVYISVSGTWK